MQDKPREVLCATLNKWDITNADIAGVVLSDSIVKDGRTDRDRAQDKVWVSRNFIHTEPEQYYKLSFGAFDAAARTLHGRIKQSAKAPGSNDDIVEVLGGPAAEEMRDSMDAWGLDGTAYLNCARRLKGHPTRSAGDTATLLVMLFVMTGCTGDAAGAVREVSRCARQMGSEMRTRAPRSAASGDDARAAGETSLCLLRLGADGGLIGGPYRLEPAGTVIGAFPEGASTISDVDEGVSGSHLRIWREGARTWYAQGMGSSFGTVHVCGPTGERTVVEAPRDERAAAGESQPVQVDMGDRLILAKTTVFAVMRA